MTDFDRALSIAAAAKRDAWTSQITGLAAAVGTTPADVRARYFNAAHAPLGPSHAANEESRLEEILGSVAILGFFGPPDPAQIDAFAAGLKPACCS